MKKAEKGNKAVAAATAPGKAPAFQAANGRATVNREQIKAAIVAELRIRQRKPLL